MKRFLVIGGTGVAGGAAIKAVRERFGADADVTAVWYGKTGEPITIDGADRAVFGDISDPACWDEVEAAAGNRFDYLFYATAFGEVGFPSSSATPEQVADSNRLSFDPLVKLEERFDVGHCVSYSTFYNLAHQRVTYGAMAHSKSALENWTAKPGKSHRVCIRAGAFVSGSSTAIKLLVRRNAAKLAAMDEPILQKLFSGVKPKDAVEAMQAAVFQEERETYGDSGTDADGLVAAHLKMFDEPEAHFICVSGSRVWIDPEPQSPPLATPPTSV
ncbi:MAG: NAD-dependent epimerase/dehydratase family protein [Leptospirillia bacterium]